MEKLIDILKEIRPEFEWKHAENIIRNGMLDSFDIILLVTELDSVFGISVDGSDIVQENFSSLESISNLIRKSGGVL